MPTSDPTKHLLGYGRRDAATGMLHSHIRWPHGTTPPPFGCRWCGQEQRVHGRTYLPRRGHHTWEQPTEAQIKARMLARRAARKAVCRCVEPWQQYPLAPVVDPWKCEADDCRMHDYLLGLWMTPLSSDEAMRLSGGGQ
ncbi:hypothetical protein [Streptomyces sp. BBFR109]|uniref:hypothetical protein n=1 Tax=Streptomyces sp. BBFR109 TaxID=3448172 RepID=UPI003F7678ED